MKAYNAFRTQVENIKTEKDLKDAHNSICRAYSAYRVHGAPEDDDFQESRKRLFLGQRHLKNGAGHGG